MVKAIDHPFTPDRMRAARPSTGVLILANEASATGEA